MKRTLLVLAFVGVAGLLVSALAAFAQSSPRSVYGQRQVGDPLVTQRADGTVVRPARTMQPSTDDDKLIDELATILNETKSPETFLVTAMTLGRLGSKARRTLPVVIRNAERLELLDGLCDNNAASDNRVVAQGVVEVIEMIVGGNSGVYVRREKRLPQPVCYPATPAPAMSYGGYSSVPPPSPATPMRPPVSPYEPVVQPPQPIAPSIPSPGVTQSEERLSPVPLVTR